jgi:hypothetical protein
MKRHWDDGVHTGQDVVARVPHEPAERPGEQPAALVFESVNDVA